MRNSNPQHFLVTKGVKKKQTEIHIEFFRGGPGIFVVVRAFTFFTRFSWPFSGFPRPIARVFTHQIFVDFITPPSIRDFRVFHGFHVFHEFGCEKSIFTNHPWFVHEYLIYMNFTNINELLFDISFCIIYRKIYYICIILYIYLCRKLSNHIGEMEGSFHGLCSNHGKNEIQ